MGDDLEQNWAQDDDIQVSLSDDDLNYTVEDVKDVMNADSKDESSKNDEEDGTTGRKRSAPPTTSVDGIAIVKKRRHARGARGKRRETVDLSTDSKVCDFLWQQYITIMGDKLTALELEDTRPSLNRFLPTAVEQEGAASMVKRCLANWRMCLHQDTSKNSSPDVIVVSGSSNRCCDVIKQLSIFKVPVAKLFSRHMKPEQQKNTLKKTYYPLGVATPSRLLKLLDLGFVSMPKLIIFDVSPDVKGYSIFSQKDTRGDAAVLMQRHFLRNEELQFVCMLN